MRFLSTCPTSQFAVVEFETVERVGAVQQHVALGVDGLQLLQRGFTSTNTLQARENVKKKITTKMHFFKSKSHYIEIKAQIKEANFLHLRCQQNKKSNSTFFRLYLTEKHQDLL